MFRRRVLACLVTLPVAGCARPPPASLEADGPALEPLDFFSGEVRSWGVIENRSGDPTETVRTASTGTRDGAVLVIRQRLAFGDGREQVRVWRLEKLDRRRYVGTADDVVGAAEGTLTGRVFRWRYTLALEPGNPLLNVVMDHWMYLLDDGTLLNRVTVSKLGLTVAHVSEHFRRGAGGGT